MRILGIDPGTTRIGYGLVEKAGDVSLLKYGSIEISAQDDASRLLELGSRLDRLIKETKPDLAGVEKLYFSKNQKTALAVSQSRGLILYLLKKRGIHIKELRPSEVKIAVANYGLADKSAVALMVKKILRVDELAGYDDATDALAIAICAAYGNGA